MHEKGILHADIKPLNIMRIDNRLLLIDLDAACRIGVDSVGFKSSSAFVPPEAIYVDKEKGIAVVKSEESRAANNNAFDLLIAHESFDVWALGCILYAMGNEDAMPPFVGGQDDNLSSDRSKSDNLFALQEWSVSLKSKKLQSIKDPALRNLVSQMLSKDPKNRPTLQRVLAHPFLSMKKVVRMLGDKPLCDLFFNYRVNSDAAHVKKLYDILTARGLKVIMSI